MSLVLPLLLLTAGCAGALLWVRHAYVVVTVQGESMEPTYHAGERVLARQGRLHQISSSDVVILLGVDSALDQPRQGLPNTSRKKRAKHGTRTYLIKRVLAAPGDRVPREQVPTLRDSPHSLVPPGRVVLLGDNAATSYDSREHGYFSLENVIGRVVRRLPNQPR
ncbi:S26 family signal peptidase [Nonomuraea typhae]|uniref:S26 family signal peptidase n=1 Tax=Nonomuraea typhae TaxID=2603600 RepID=A0ABW7YL34_9ACTN